MEPLSAGTAEGRRRVAWVTGAARGLGEGAARRLARDGFAVLLFDALPEVSETAHAIEDELDLPEGQVFSQVGDVADAGDIDTAVRTLLDRFGAIDVVVANAGIGGSSCDLVDLDPTEFDHVMDVNVRGVFLTCQAAGRAMRNEGSGSIIATSSIFGVEPHAGAAAYSASKAAVIAMLKALAVELAPFNVRVNSIAPGYMATEMQWASIRARATERGTCLSDERERVANFVPLGRFGTPSDYGAAVAFLASDDATYITGHTLGVTGGVVRW